MFLYFQNQLRWIYDKKLIFTFTNQNTYMHATENLLLRMYCLNYLNTKKCNTVQTVCITNVAASAESFPVSFISVMACMRHFISSVGQTTREENIEAMLPAQALLKLLKKLLGLFLLYLKNTLLKFSNMTNLLTFT